MPTDDVLQELFSIRGKVAVVTGGTRGIGLMIAEAYVRAGAKVYVSSRKADVVAETERALSELGECIGIPADLSTEAECRRLADEISSREDQVHILVNNAGATWGAPLDEYDDAALGPGARPQRQGRVPPHEVPPPAARSRVDRRRPGAASSTSGRSTASRCR